MRGTSSQHDVDALRSALAARTASGWALYEGSGLLSGSAAEGLELIGRPGELVLRAVGAGRLWRIVAWEERGGELRLSVRGAFGRVERVVRIHRDGRGPLVWGPEWFEEAVRTYLEHRYDPHSVRLKQTGNRFAGSVSSPDGRRHAVIALGPDGSHRDVNDHLAAGLVARARIEHNLARPAELVIVSTGAALRAFAHRLVWFDPKANARLVDAANPNSEIRPHDQGMLVDAGPVFWPRPKFRPNPLVERMLAVLPGALRRAQSAGERIDRVTLRGLECAVACRDRASFGIGRTREALTEATWPRFESFVRDLDALRSAESADRAHPAYRLYPERWLAALLRDDVTRIDPVLDASAVYEQVPARRGDSREYIDMLAVTRTGRLAVIELKASESRALPLQGLDYWSRVRWHHANGDIARRGYFPGVALDPRPPLLYLVAPMFSLHASVQLAVGLFVPDVETIVVGLNTDWRRGPRALVRQKF